MNEMNDEAIEAAKKRKAQEILEALVSDKLFCDLVPMYWSSLEANKSTNESDNESNNEPDSEPNEKKRRFADRVFPMLAKHHSGKELSDLIEGHQWLKNLSIPVERHESARIFHEDTARNLTILDVVIKLQFLKKMLNDFLEEEGSEKKLDCMKQDFDGQWESFMKRNGEKYREYLKIPYDDSIFFGKQWFEDIRYDRILFREAMSAFLEKSRDPNAYSRQWFFLDEVISSWINIKEEADSGVQFDFIPTTLWKIWQKIMWSRLVEHKFKPWWIFIDNFWSFCIAAGCPEADRQDPLRSLQALRNLVSRQFAYTASLHNMISKQNKQIILQQRMITALAYRNIMENVSATVKADKPTVKWHIFIEQIFEDAKNGKILPGHPFKAIFDQHSEEKASSLLKQMAKDLYSTLSRTIHRFQPSKDFDQYTPMPGQFDPMQIDFLSAMNPTTKDNGEHGSPEWEAERRRYAKKKEDEENIHPAPEPDSQPETSQKKKKKKKKKQQASLQTG